MIFFFGIDPELAGHVLTAMTGYRHALARNSERVPTSVDALLHVVRTIASNTADNRVQTAPSGTRVGHRGDMATPLLDYDAAAAVLGCSPRTVRRRVVAGELTPVREGGRVMFRRETLHAYIERCER